MRWQWVSFFAAFLSVFSACGGVYTSKSNFGYNNGGYTSTTPIGAKGLFEGTRWSTPPPANFTTGYTALTPSSPDQMLHIGTVGNTNAYQLAEHTPPGYARIDLVYNPGTGSSISAFTHLQFVGRISGGGISWSAGCPTNFETLGDFQVRIYRGGSTYSSATFLSSGPVMQNVSLSSVGEFSPNQALIPMAGAFNGNFWIVSISSGYLGAVSNFCSSIHVLEANLYPSVN